MPHRWLTPHWPAALFVGSGCFEGPGKGLHCRSTRPGERFVGRERPHERRRGKRGQRRETLRQKGPGLLGRLNGPRRGFELAAPRGIPSLLSLLMQQTSLHAAHVAAGAKMVEFGGWHMPVQYGPILDEVRTVRQGTGLFDLGHMGRFRFSGPDAVALVDRVATCFCGKIPIDSIRYGPALPARRRSDRRCARLPW